MNSSTPDPRRSTPGSLQKEVHYVQEQRAAQGGRKASKVVLGGGVVAALLAAGYFVPRFGWGPGGAGAGNGTAGTERTTMQEPTTSTALRPAQPVRPLRVVTDGDNYLVNGKPADLAAVLKLAAQVPAGPGPEVEVECKPTSRVKTEERLKEALKEANLTSSWPASLN